MQTINVYSPVWHKYRPAILRMMIEAAQEPQQYKLSAHEFKALNARKKSGFQFTLQVAGGKAVNNIKESAMAQELLEMLQLSPRGSTLIQESSYEIVMDKAFVLHISKLNQQKND